MTINIKKLSKISVSLRGHILRRREAKIVFFVKQGNHIGQEFALHPALNNDPLKIGRDPTAALSLVDEGRVSSFHGKISVGDGLLEGGFEYFYTDNESTNGSWVFEGNSHRKKKLRANVPLLLKEGMRILLAGDAVLQVKSLGNDVMFESAQPGVGGGLVPTNTGESNEPIVSEVEPNAIDIEEEYIDTSAKSNIRNEDDNDNAKSNHSDESNHNSNGGGKEVESGESENEPNVMESEIIDTSAESNIRNEDYNGNSESNDSDGEYINSDEESNKSSDGGEEDDNESIGSIESNFEDDYDSDDETIGVEYNANNLKVDEVKKLVLERINKTWTEFFRIIEATKSLTPKEVGNSKNKKLTLNKLIKFFKVIDQLQYIYHQLLSREIEITENSFKYTLKQSIVKLNNNFHINHPRHHERFFPHRRVAHTLRELCNTMVLNNGNTLTRAHLNIIVSCKSVMTGAITLDSANPSTEGDDLSKRKLGYVSTIATVPDSFVKSDQGLIEGWDFNASGAAGLCIVEKQGLFLQLLKFIKRNKLVALCTQGVPDLNARAAASMIVQRQKIPVFAVTDLGPDGLNIERLFSRLPNSPKTHNSMTDAEKKYLVPLTVRLGLNYDQVAELALDYQPLSVADGKKLDSLLDAERLRLDNEATVQRWYEQGKKMKEMKENVETKKGKKGPRVKLDVEQALSPSLLDNFQQTVNETLAAATKSQQCPPLPDTVDVASPVSLSLSPVSTFVKSNHEMYPV